MTNEYVSLSVKVALSTLVALVTFVIGAYVLASIFGEQVPFVLHSVDTLEKLAGSLISDSFNYS